jgi:hypothetical protein
MRLMRGMGGISPLAFHDAADRGAHSSAEKIGDFALDALGGLVLGRTGSRLPLVRLRLVSAAGMMLAVRVLVI